MNATYSHTGIRLHIAPGAEVPRWLLKRCVGFSEIIVKENVTIIEIRGASAQFGFNFLTGYKDVRVELPGLIGSWFCGFTENAVMKICDLGDRILEKNEVALTPV